MALLRYRDFSWISPRLMAPDTLEAVQQAVEQQNHQLMGVRSSDTGFDANALMGRCSSGTHGCKHSFGLANCRTVQLVYRQPSPVLKGSIARHLAGYSQGASQTPEKAGITLYIEGSGTPQIPPTHPRANLADTSIANLFALPLTSRPKVFCARPEKQCNGLQEGFVAKPATPQV